MVVNAVVPNFGPHTGNTAITVMGEGFDHAVAITIGGQNAHAVYVSDSQFTATSPALAWPSSLPVDLVVTNGDAQTQTLLDEFNYEALPL